MTEEQIPYGINDTFQAGWWKPIAINGDDTYIAYTSPSGTIVNGNTGHYINIAKKDVNGDWTTARLQSKSVDATYKDDAGHRQTSIAVDGDGRIHVITSMHGSWWTDDPNEDGGFGHYYRSDDPGDITTMVDRSTEMPNQSSSLGHDYRYTYPILATHPNGDVYLIIRREENGNAPMIMYQWDNANSVWNIIGRVADKPNPSADTAFVYPDDLKITSDGKVHIAYSWHKNSSSGRRHRGSYMNYDPTTGVFKAANGVTKTIPVDWADGDLWYQPLGGSETLDWDDPLQGVQSARIAIQPSGQPHIAYRYRAVNYETNRVRHATFSSGAWFREEIWVPGVYEDSLASIDMVHDGVNINIYYIRAVGGRNRLWVANKSSSWLHSQVSDLGIERVYLEQGVLYGVVTPYNSSSLLGNQFLLT